MFEIYGLSVCLSVCMSVCLSCLCASQYLYLAVCLVCVTVRLSVCLSD